MRVQTFKNMKGLIHGEDPKRIGCDREGVLEIGNREKIRIAPKEDSILPLLFHGASGDYKATFTDKHGHIYDLGKVAIRGGRIAPPSPTAVEIMELQCRADAAEDECAALRQKIRD